MTTFPLWFRSVADAIATAKLLARQRQAAPLFVTYAPCMGDDPVHGERRADPYRVDCEEFLRGWELTLAMVYPRTGRVDYPSQGRAHVRLAMMVQPVESERALRVCKDALARLRLNREAP